MREEVFKTVGEIVENDKRTLLMLVDIGAMGFHEVLKNIPDRAKNMGIFEDGMVSVAAGMALKGMIPIIYGISPFIVDRALEQLKIDFVFQKLGGNFMTTGAAYDFSKAGYTHFCPEDVGVLKMLPGMEFIAPGTSRQFASLFRETYDNGNPTYIRLSDFENEIDIDVKMGEANIIKKGSQATVIAVGSLLDSVVEACKDEDVTVLYYTTLEPFDGKTLIHNLEKNKILLCEPSYEGGLAFDIINVCRGRAIQLDFVGLPREIIRKNGTKEEKDRYYNVTASEIKKKVIYLKQSLNC